MSLGERPRISKGELKRAPVGFVRLLSKCWDSNPDKRPTFSQTLRQLRRVAHEDLKTRKTKQAGGSKSKSKRREQGSKSGGGGGGDSSGSGHSDAPWTLSHQDGGRKKEQRKKDALSKRASKDQIEKLRSELKALQEKEAVFATSKDYLMADRIRENAEAVDKLLAAALALTCEMCGKKEGLENGQKFCMLCGSTRKTTIEILFAEEAEEEANRPDAVEKKMVEQYYQKKKMAEEERNAVAAAAATTPTIAAPEREAMKEKNHESGGVGCASCGKHGSASTQFCMYCGAPRQ